MPARNTLDKLNGRRRPKRTRPRPLSDLASFVPVGEILHPSHRRSRRDRTPRRDLPNLLPVVNSFVDPGCLREQKWLRDHESEFAGQWVALFGDRLISNGGTAKEVVEESRRQGFDDALIVHVPDELELPFGGW